MYTGEDFPDATLSEAGDFCRNPDFAMAPWCYTENAEWEWEYCDLPLCKGKMLQEGCNQMHTYFIVADTDAYDEEPENNLKQH